MAVQILNDMPDAAVHRGEPVREFLRDLNLPRSAPALNSRLSGRAVFLAATIAIHVVGAHRVHEIADVRSASSKIPMPIIASLIEAPRAAGRNAAASTRRRR